MKGGDEEGRSTDKMKEGGEGMRKEDEGMRGLGRRCWREGMKTSGR